MYGMLFYCCFCLAASLLLLLLLLSVVRPRANRVGDE
jgi:hypothetical protein